MCMMSYSDGFDDIRPSVYKEGDLVVSGFSPFYTLTQDSEMQQKFLCDSSKQRCHILPVSSCVCVNPSDSYES